MPLVVVLGGCGQAGELYLPDNLRAQQLQQEAERAPTEARATALRDEARKLQQRYQQEQQLRTDLASEEAREQSLRAAGNQTEADEALKQVNRIRYDLGQLILQQQSR